MQKTAKIFVIFILIFILGIFYLSLYRTSNYNTEYLAGNKLTDFRLESLQEKVIYTSDDFKKNDYTLINFWASWCGPCRIEHPILMELSKENNVKILGINFKDKKNNALKFLDDLGNPYDYLAKDTKGKKSVTFGIYGIPESILIDKNFIILKKFIGPLNDNDFNEIKKITNSL
tara:strand:+ start:2519 stop:3040 length:522 start_codon:yes stop_codon:yes gene_type:complete